MNVGEVWYVRHGAGLCVFKARITDITELTIEIENLSAPISSLPEWRKSRYVRGELHLIELIEKPKINEMEEILKSIEEAK